MIDQKAGINGKLIDASKAYLKFLNGTGTKVLLDYVTDMPQTRLLRRSDMIDVMVGMVLTLFLPLLFTWIILQLFPVMLTSLVYEKQQKLRVMMKMHGLGDGPYWMITYSYFLFLSSVYILGFMVSGYLIGLPIFKCTAFSILFTFYFTYIYLQISFAFLMATLSLHVKTATVIAHMFVFGSGLLGMYVFQSVLQSPSFSRDWIIILEMFPPFALYRGNYEFQEYTQRERYLGYAVKMSWNDINDGENGMRRVFILMAIEWFVMLIVAYYLDQVISLGNGVRKHPLFFLKNMSKKLSASNQQLAIQTQQLNFRDESEKPDVSQEREKVKELILLNDTTDSIVCDNLKKVYPSIDGNPEKVAVRGLSLALGRGECFGMLGPNGAGKTSFISMMIGLTEPTSGMALVNGLDIQTDMDQIYASMGVCPQHELKNLKGSDLTEAVEESLKSVNLYHGGVADKQARTYSGGMKRRLSVAISLIGDPKVVYMDEPSTGLDPSSRNHLWNIVKRAKKDRAIILTTHSMEEAEALCDRLGIFADGSLQCIGNPKELKARYGGSYVFTMTTSVDQEEEVEKLICGLSSNASKIYHLSGTQKFEISKKDVRIGDVFRAVENAKREFPIYAWGLTDTTLEDVFIKVAQAALASSSTM
ncbi:ABC transporter A family member 7-like isoform X2 [Papaver somniferum]|nr:ABC transporter A family member 7-like isoform X2 [Papaver somniferum]